VCACDGDVGGDVSHRDGLIECGAQASAGDFSDSFPIMQNTHALAGTASALKHKAFEFSGRAFGGNTLKSVLSDETTRFWSRLTLI
jgi:hypothetical protein